MKLGMQVGPIGPGHTVLDGDPAPPRSKGHSPPIFGPYMLRPNGCMDQVSLGMEVGLGPGDFVLDGDPAPPKGGGAEASNFRPMYILVKRLDG